MNPDETDETLKPFHAGLRALSQTVFPKICACGRIYQTFEGFIAETTPLRDKSGLMAYGRHEAIEVGMFRNCSCGSTLVIFCDDRRDESPSGTRRREIFEELLSSLEKSGVPRAEARSRLVRALRTGNHDLFGE